jgi:uncharacterized protein YlxW (UPF0749 family)
VTGTPSDSEPAPPPPEDGGVAAPLSLLTRLGFVLGMGLFGVLIVTSAQSEPVEARRGHRHELVELIGAEQARNAELSRRVEELSAQLADLGRVGSEGGAVQLAALQEQIDALAAPAGLVAVRGPGVTVTLRDSRVPPQPDEDYNDFVIHEQDLQAVINALWSGGAEAMAVNGNRILSTTAIRCVGNVLLLHGATHSPPYVIDAIGDEVALRGALDRDAAVAVFAEAVTTYQLGFEVVVVPELTVPAYEGSTAMQVAAPVDASSGR